MDLRRGQIMRLVLLSILVPLATPVLSGGMVECLSMRALAEDLIAKARRAEYALANEKCPESQFRTKLNSVSQWAWETNTKARQACRDDWRAATPYLYRDLFGNGYRSPQGVLIAKNLEVLGVEIESGRCPLSDLSWQPEKEVRPKQVPTRMSWDEKLESNPSLRAWAENHQDLAETQRKKWEATRIHH